MHCPRRAVMRKKDPLRPVTGSERRALEQLARSHSAPALSVARARALLAVSQGSSYTEAAQLVGRAVGDSIAQWVTLFNQVGFAAVERQPGGRPPTQYGAEERDRILAEFRRPPDRERDGTATWSLNTLQRALRRAPDGLPKVSTYTIWAVLHDAGITWQRDRTWCQTAQLSASASVARSQSTTRMPARKKPDRAGLHRRGAHGVGRVGHGRSRPVPGHSSARHALAARRSACSVSARTRSSRHRQAADVVPPSDRPGARQGRDELSERRPARLAGGGVAGHPGRVAACEDLAAGRQPS